MNNFGKNCNNKMHDGERKYVLDVLQNKIPQRLKMFFLLKYSFLGTLKKCIVNLGRECKIMYNDLLCRRIM